MKTRHLLTLVVLFSAIPAVWADDFRQDSKITQLVGDVQSQPLGSTEHPAQLQELLVPGDLLKTGADSRAELTAADTTVIRVGSNSIFSFSNQSRQMILQQGSLLFHTPHGQGGGVIKTAAVTAAVTGSTVAMSTTSSGGAKVVPLESPCTVTGADGRQIARLNPGQMLALLPGAKPLIIAIDLAAFTKSSGLINRFGKPLSKEVQGKIDQNAKKQASLIEGPSSVTLFDDLAVQFPVRPPTNVQAPALFSPNTTTTFSFDPGFLSAVQTNLTIGPGNLSSSLGSNIYPTVNFSALSSSPVLYLAQQYGLTDPTSGIGPNGPTYSEASSLNKIFLNLGVPGYLDSTSGVTEPSSLFTTGKTVIGNNITFTSGDVPEVPSGDDDVPDGGLSSDPNVIDLSGVKSAGTLSIVALGNITYTGNASTNEQDISLLNAPTNVTLGAMGTFTFDGSAQSTQVLFYALDTANLYFASVGTMTIDNFDFLLPGDSSFNLGSNSDVNLTWVGIDFNHSPLGSGTGQLNIDAGHDLNIDGSLYTGNGGYFFRGNSNTPSVVNLTAGHNISITGYYANFTAATSGTSSVNMNAGNEIDVGTSSTSVSFSNFTNIYMKAPTINLFNVDLGYANVALHVSTGQGNFTGSVLPGYANLFNVTSGGTTISAGYHPLVSISQ